MTKGRISLLGALSITRGTQDKIQGCPRSEDDGRFCGDWCPLFGEPEHVVDGWPSPLFGEPEHVLEDGRPTLEICQGRTLVFDKFFDDRK